MSTGKKLTEKVYVTQPGHEKRGDESTLKLEAKDSRAGKYACSAENAIGRSHIVDVAELFVESQPIVAIK